jgi:Uma2 family endonuclease
MTAVPKKKLTVAEYLAIEQKAERKSEFFNGEMFAMAGASPHHNYLNENLSVLVGGRLWGGPCRTVSRDFRTLVDRTGLYTYPDVIIVCGEPQYDTLDRDSLVNPRVIFEVLSPSAEKYDRTTKFRHYQQIPTMMEYLLVSQDEALIEQFVRQDDDTWKYFSFVGLEANFQLATVNSTPIPMADIYRGVTLATDIR